MELAISLMQRGDVPALARLLSAAMLHNPLHVAVFGGRDGAARVCIGEMFVELFRDAPRQPFLAKIASEPHRHLGP